MVHSIAMPDHTLKSLAETVGPLPDGDIPAAWYLSLDPEVIKGYSKFKWEHKAWRDRVAELLELSKIPTHKARYATLGSDTLLGFYIDIEPPAFWRKDKKGYIVPRVRTKAEKNSEITKRFRTVQVVPRAIDYMVGFPHSLSIAGPDPEFPEMKTVFLPQVRRPAQAVLVFLGANPDHACEPFEPDARWSRMKLSTFHLLRERQAAEAALSPNSTPVNPPTKVLDSL